MKKFALCILPFVASALIGCGDEVTSSLTDTKANLYLKIKTTDLGKADSIKVTVVGTKRTATSDSLGVLTLNEMQVGSYKLQIEKSGYAPMICDVNIPMASDDEESAVAAEITREYTLSKVGFKLEGVARITKMGAVSDLKDATIDAELSPYSGDCEFVSARVSATTSDKGAYSFANLPEMASVRLSPRAVTVDGKVYSSTQSLNYSGIRAGVTQVVPTAFQYSIAASTFAMDENNLDTLGLTNAIVVKFSKSVDVARIRSGDLKVTLGGQTLATTASWADDNRTLTLNPAVSSKWPTGSMNLVGTLFSSDDHQQLNLNKTFSVFFKGSLDSVKGLAMTRTYTNVFNEIGNFDLASAKDTTIVDAKTTGVALKWNAVPNATSYEIYVKEAKSDSAFVLVASNVTETTYVVNSLNFAAGVKNEFLVVGVNSAARSPFGAALSFVDGEKPSVLLSTNNGLNIPRYNNTKTSPDTLTSYTKASYFTEEMDTTKAPTFAVSGAATDKVSFYGRWINTHAFRIYPVVKASTDITALGAFDVTVDVSGCLDQNKNAPKGNVTLVVTPQ